MKGRNTVRDADELFRRINRASAEAEWTSEELRSDLRAGGVDPERLVNHARARVKRLLNGPQAATGRSPEESARANLLPLLRELRKRTGLMAPDIAAEMGVPLAFLSAVERHPQAVPSSWRAELAARVERSLRVSGDVVIASLETPRRVELAALSGVSPADDTINYESILDESGMDEDARQYWLSLATSGRSL